MVTTPELTRLVAERNARVYHLGDPATATEIWFVLHGFGQLAGQFIKTFDLAARPGRLIVAPEALNHFYTDHRAKKVGASWMTSEDRDAQIADYVHYLDRVAEQFVRGAAARIEVHGFSQGSATAARWVALGKIRPARLVIWGGEMPPDPAVETWKDRLSSVDLAIVMGDQDEYYSQDRVDVAAERLDAAGVNYTLHRFQGGHLVSPEVLAVLSGG
jgi:predicted esterase